MTSTRPTPPGTAPLTRRHFVAATLSAIAAPSLVSRMALTPRASRLAPPVPTAAQLAWQQDERALFLHFGVATFTDKEWGDGSESPSLFNPSKLDARQWAKTAKDAGFPAMILTAKHHDGFCLWPTKTTAHSVASSPWKDGHGDVMREFVDACRAEGVKPGLYCSPWDRNAATFGDSAAYNALYLAQLTELLTQYGEMHQLWFDAANGPGSDGARQTYDWPATFALVRRLQPKAIIFSDAGPDVRWLGNDRSDPSMANWSRFDPTAVPAPGAEGPRVNSALQSGHATGSVWRPAEIDVSIRPTWYHHAREDRYVKTPAALVAYYFASVGRNAKLVLNVPPNREGLISNADVTALAGMHDALVALFQNDVTAGHAPTWAHNQKNAMAEIDFGKPVAVSLIDLRENIALGQSVAHYVTEGLVDNAWTELSSGTTIGYRALDRIPTTVIQKLRVRVTEYVDTLHPLMLRAYAEPTVAAGVRKSA
jgi:alpha-L-fucosidase